MGKIRFVGTGETRGYPYLVCKKNFYHMCYKTCERPRHRIGPSRTFVLNHIHNIIVQQMTVSVQFAFGVPFCSAIGRAPDS